MLRLELEGCPLLFVEAKKRRDKPGPSLPGREAFENLSFLGEAAPHNSEIGDIDLDPRSEFDENRPSLMNL